MTDKYGVVYGGHLGDWLPGYYRGLVWKKEDESVIAAVTTIMSAVFPCPVTSHDLPFPGGKHGIRGLALDNWRSAFWVSISLAWLYREGDLAK